MTGRQRDATRTVGGAEPRRARLAEELRANLGKRKTQAKARRELAKTGHDDRSKADTDTN
ncbi:MAG: hypothetical protein ACLQF1_10750 [Methyloceanibacter sp.]|jgi:hypothetical protein